MAIKAAPKTKRVAAYSRVSTDGQTQGSTTQGVAPEPHGYVRVSTIMQRLKGYSLPKQLKDIAAAAEADGAPIPAHALLGDADSGRKFDREALQTLLARAREGRVSVVYFAKVDRIGRNARDSLNIVHELDGYGVRIVVLDPRLDTKDPFGYFLFVILAAMAELEATFILERTMGGKLEKLAQEAARIARERAVLTAQLEQVQNGQAPIKQVRDACALLADGALQTDFSNRKWLIGLLVEVIYADQHGWQLRGYLPDMEAEGMFGAASIDEHTP